MRRWLNLTRCLSVLVVLLGVPNAQAGLILNEYNAVRSTRWLDADGVAESTAEDTYFGRIEGNGGRWFETLAVGSTSNAGETLDLRGWSFSWTDLDLGSGSFTLSNHLALGSIHRGTLITFFSQDAGGPNVGSNLLGVGASTAAGGDLAQYDPTAGSWWLNINIADAALASGSLNTGNDDWQVTIRDSDDNDVFGPAGEGIGSLSGVNSREVGKLESTFDSIAGWQSITPLTGNYEDGTSSSFGGANLWNGGSNSQNFSSLQIVPEPSALLLVGSALGAGFLRRRRS